MNLESLSMWHDWGGGRPEVNLYFEYSSSCLQLVLLSQCRCQQSPHSPETLQKIPIPHIHREPSASPQRLEAEGIGNMF